MTASAVVPVEAKLQPTGNSGLNLQRPLLFSLPLSLFSISLSKTPQSSPPLSLSKTLNAIFFDEISSFPRSSGRQHGHDIVSASDFIAFVEIFTNRCRNGLLVDDVDESVGVSSGHTVVLGSEFEIDASSTSTASFGCQSRT
ncbi:hypothetical protein FF1_033169 [Malus domestica]